MGAGGEEREEEERIREEKERSRGQRGRRINTVLKPEHFAARKLWLGAAFDLTF